MLKIAFMISLLVVPILSKPKDTTEEDPQYWHDLSLTDLDLSLLLEKNKNIAKNIIIFIGDGLGISTLTAARIHKAQLNGNTNGEGISLALEELPHVGLMKTYDVSHQVSDSASTATAILCGSKAQSDVIGMSGAVDVGEETTCDKPVFNVNSIGQYAYEADKDVGVVTTARITHATPAALYAHSPDRGFECDGIATSHNCKDIARQLIENEPGSKLKVIMGGGRQKFRADPGVEATEEDPILEDSCKRLDRRNLIDEWLASKEGFNANYVYNKEGFDQIEPENTDYLLGLFSNGHLPYKYEDASANLPNLAEMATKAVEILSKNQNGYFLLIEGAKIDLAHHVVQANAALLETIDFDNAVAAILELVDIEETLVIVTADHSHPVVIHGYPSRGNDITGLVDNDGVPTDNLPYTVMMYTNGGSFNKSYEVNGDDVVRVDISSDDVNSYTYQQAAVVPTEDASETHSGEDVAIYATGPMSHLFHGLHEQTFIHFVMTYASCIGPYHDTDDCRSGRTNTVSTSKTKNNQKHKNKKYFKYLV